MKQNEAKPESHVSRTIIDIYWNLRLIISGLFAAINGHKSNPDDDAAYERNLEALESIDEHEDNLAFENKSMGDFLEKIGLSQEDVSSIANGSTQFYCVHVVCENALEYYSMYTSEEKAKEKYLDLCKEWYNKEGVEKFNVNNSFENDVTTYVNYYGSKEYHNSCDYAHVSLEYFS